MAKETTSASAHKAYKAANEARNKQNKVKKMQRQSAGLDNTKRVQPGDVIVKINKQPVEVPETPTTCTLESLVLKYEYISCLVVDRDSKKIRIENPKLVGLGFSYSTKRGGIVVRTTADIGKDPKMELRWDLYIAQVNEKGVAEVKKDPEGILGKDLGDISLSYGQIAICILNHSSGYRGSRLIYSKGCNPYMQVHVLRDPDSGVKDFYLMVKDSEWNWIPKRRIEPDEFPKEILEFLKTKHEASANSSVSMSWKMR